jgi:hypothetical protein
MSAVPAVPAVRDENAAVRDSPLASTRDELQRGGMPTNTTSLLLVAIALMLAPARSRAQSTASRIIDAPLSTAHLVPGVQRWRILRRAGSGDTTATELGQWTIERRVLPRTSPTSPEILLTVSTFATRGGTVVDSIETMRATLVPVLETSHQPTKEMHLAFAGMHVTGTVTPKDSTPQAVDYTSPRPLFNSSDVVDVITSLPLRAGGRWILPSYTYERGGIGFDTVAVTGTATVPAGAHGGASHVTWVVRDADDNSIATYWIDRRTRELVARERVGRGASARLVFERID